MSKMQSNNGIGFFTLLFLVFLTLKLCGVIDWSWWWVTAPLWGGIVAALVLASCVFAVVLFGLLLAAAIGKWGKP